MNKIDILSLLLFILFLASYIFKLIILYTRHGIKANVLAKGSKGGEIDSTEILIKITTFLWGVVWFVESTASNFIRNVAQDFFNNDAVRYAGITIISIGIIVFITAMISMKTSWRVGIDKETRSALITNGIYKYSRNPAFVGFDLMFLGVFLTYSNLFTLIILIINVLSMHKLILQEEKHLEGAFNGEYIDYRNKTPRYLIF